MIDLTPEGLRGRAKNWFDVWAMRTVYDRAQLDDVQMLADEFTALVTEARVDVLHEVNQLACGGLSSSLSIKGMLAMHDRHVVAEARRAQRTKDMRTTCAGCRMNRPVTFYPEGLAEGPGGIDGQTFAPGWIHDGDGKPTEQCYAAAIRAQGETP